MKNLITYLKALWSRVADSQSTDVSLDCRRSDLRRSPSFHRRSTMLKLVSVLVLILTIGSGNVWGETLFSQTGTSGYSIPDGWSNSGTSTGSYLGFTSNGAYLTSPLYEPHDNLSLAYTVACYGSGTNHALVIQLLDEDGTVKKTHTTGKPTSTTYISTNSPWNIGDVDYKFRIKFYLASAGKGVRLRNFSLTGDAVAPATYNVYLMSGCTGGSYSSNKGTSGSGTGTYSSCTKYSGISSGTSVTITATPSSGYQFDGWTDGGYSIILDDESNEITPSSTTSTTATFTMPSSDVVIWDCNFSETCANTMTINKGTATNCTFSLGTSGSGIASCSGVSTIVTVTPNTGYGTPVVTQSGASATPTITGSGTSWTVTYPANTTSTSTINVSCSANNYTITLNTDLTPTSSGTTSITATYNANTNLTSAITKPTKTSWTFGGYFTAKNGGGTQIIDASGNVIASVSGYTDASRNWKYAGNITLYAKWTCTVTWSVNGLTNVYSTQTVTYNSSGSKVASVPTPDPASYCGDIFAGWSRKNAGAESKTTSYYDDLFKTVGDSPDIKSIGNIIFYAVFADEN